MIRKILEKILGQGTSLYRTGIDWEIKEFLTILIRCCQKLPGDHMIDLEKNIKKIA